MPRQPPSPTSRQSKHHTVYEALREEILAGRYSPESRMPGEAELVIRFGASRPTVARALNDLEREGLVERRAGSGTYAKAPTPPAEASAPPQAGTFGLIIPELGHTEIFVPICAAMARATRGTGYSLLWG